MSDISHLQRITIRGNGIESSQNSWIMVLSDLKKAPSPEVALLSFFKSRCSASGLWLITLLITIEPHSGPIRPITHPNYCSVPSIGFF